MSRLYSPMQTLLKNTLSVAVINPRKKIGEEGQYIRYRGDHHALEEVLAHARAEGFEIRRYIENLLAEDGGVIPLKHVISEVPPMYVQPFHHHTEVDEVNMTLSGEVYFIESDTLTEQDAEAIRAQGVLLRAGDSVISAPGKRHTVANLSREYAHTIATLFSKMSVLEFKPDWKR